MKFLYIVQLNDTILSISEKFKVNPEKLIKENNIKDGKLVKGSMIKIPSR